MGCDGGREHQSPTRERDDGTKGARTARGNLEGGDEATDWTDAPRWSRIRYIWKGSCQWTGKGDRNTRRLGHDEVYVPVRLVISYHGRNSSPEAFSVLVVLIDLTIGV